LRKSELSEVKWLAEQIQASAMQQKPGSFSNSCQEDVLEPTDNPLSKIALSDLKKGSHSNSQMTTLEQVWPKNEFSLLTDVLYPYSTLSRSDIMAELENWSYDKKREALTASLNQNSNVVLAEARYRWGIVADNNTLNMLTSRLKVQELQTQPSSPSYGYDVP